MYGSCEEYPVLRTVHSKDRCCLSLTKNRSSVEFKEWFPKPFFHTYGSLGECLVVLKKNLSLVCLVVKSLRLRFCWIQGPAWDWFWMIDALIHSILGHFCTKDRWSIRSITMGIPQRMDRHSERIKPKAQVKLIAKDFDSPRSSQGTGLGYVVPRYLRSLVCR
jgi:hypothetical protein